MKKALCIILIILICVLILVVCCGKPIITSIHYDNGNAELAAEEEFYQDENYVYFFPTIRSGYITVTYLNRASENIRSALDAGRVTIADLDRFHIAYYTKPKK